MTTLLAPRLTELRKQAMKEKNDAAKRTWQAVAAAFKQKTVDERLDSLSSEQEIAIIVKMVKQRKESVVEYEKANRPELAEKEKEEIALLEGELPKQMTDEEVEVEVSNALAELGEVTMKDMGKIMGKLSGLKGKADMGLVNRIVRSKLS